MYRDFGFLKACERLLGCDLSPELRGSLSEVLLKLVQEQLENADVGRFNFLFHFST